MRASYMNHFGKSHYISFQLLITALHGFKLRQLYTGYVCCVFYGLAVAQPICIRLLDAICQHTCTDDASTAITWAAPRNKKYQFLKRNLAHIGMAQCMNAQTRSAMHAHSDVHSITWPHYSSNNHPYISSSDTPVGTKFTATYVEMVVE